ncbi:MAG: KpsF/GutQ family sugar-phosphate isomerase [Bacteroidales bacterium]|nr:KpsF/GutQ family sugar-phosphate isomerase [Bacteroidales bacterium]
MTKNILEMGKQCIRDEAEALLGLIPQMDDNFEKAVNMMFNCKGKVIVTGVGKSGHIGEKIAATLSSTGTPAFFVNPLDAYHGDLGSITSDDVVLAISNSGSTDELLRFVPKLLHMQVPIIGMTSDPASLLAKYSTVMIKVKVEKEACPLNLAPTSSTTSQLAMGDALAVALMQVRDFKKKDFAQFHPGGHLGRSLLTTAGDVMRTEDLPIIPEEMHLGEAIIHVSKGKLGLGISITDDNKVKGLITDGDIRRAMERWQEKFFNRTVGDILSRSPKTVTKETKIAEILKIMHQNKIHMVLVIDSENHLLGVVDHYSCMI